MSNSKLSVALMAAQAVMKNPHFDAKNPHFKSSYASLGEVRSVVLPTLREHGLLYVEWAISNCDKAGVHWRIEHVESGEVREGDLMIPLDKASAHGVGSAITYARRYSLQTIAGVIAEDDDDGNEASRPTQRPAPTQEKPQDSEAAQLVVAGLDLLKARYKKAGKLDVFTARWKEVGGAAAWPVTSKTLAEAQKVLAALEAHAKTDQV